MRHFVLLSLVTLLLSAPSGCAQEAPTDAAALITAMYDRYADTWYHTLYVTRASSSLSPDGSTNVETWREWMALPGQLRIEMGDPAERRGALFLGDSTHLFHHGVQIAVRPRRNDFLTLGFDVYGQPPEVTLEILEASGFDLGAVRTEEWQGRPTYVFGSPETKEVWIDVERLLLVRLVEPLEHNPTVPQEVRFLDHEPLDGGWIAPTVEVWMNGHKVFWDAYSDIRTGFVAEPSLFDPTNWSVPTPMPEG